jgi:hypothetical protein
MYIMTCRSVPRPTMPLLTLPHLFLRNLTIPFSLPFCFSSYAIKYRPVTMVFDFSISFPYLSSRLILPSFVTSYLPTPRTFLPKCLAARAGRKSLDTHSLQGCFKFHPPRCFKFHPPWFHYLRTFLHVHPSHLPSATVVVR